MPTRRLTASRSAGLPGLLLVTMLLLGSGAARAAFILEAEANPDPVEPAQVLDVQITVSTTTATGALTLRVLWPAELNGTPVVTDGATCPGGGCDTGEHLEWALGALGPDTSMTVGFNEQVGGLVADGTIIALQIELLEGGTIEETVNLSIEVQSDSPLEIAVDPLSDPVASAGTLVYEVVYGNTSSASAEDAELELPVPVGAAFDSATGGGVFAAGSVTWNLGSLAPNSGGRERVTVTVGAVATGTLLVVDAARLSGDVNLLAKEARAMAVSRVASQALALELEANPDPVEPAQSTDSQITVSNPTLVDTSALTLRVLWPEELSNVPVVTAGGDCPGGGCEQGEYLEWNLGVLGAQTTLTVSFNEQVRSTTPDGTLVPLEVELVEGGLPARNVSHTLITQTDSPLELAVDPLSDPVASAGTLVYELVYGNTSSASAENTILELPVPAGTTFASATGGGVHAMGTVSWNLGSLVPNSGGRERVTVTVDALVEGTLLVVDTARLSGAINSLAREARAAAVSRVAAEELQLALEVNPDPVEPSQSTDTQITVSNPTVSTTGALTLRVLWPEELSDVPVVTAGGDCVGGGCETGEYLEWVLGPLGAHTSMSVGFNEKVRNNTVDGTLVPLELELIEGGLPARNNSHTLITQTDSPLEVAVDPLPDPVASGGMQTYELHYGNTSAASAANAMLQLPLPAGTSFVSATNNGQLAGSSVSWNLVTLPPHYGGREQVTVQLDALATSTLLRVDAARLSGEVNLLPKEARAMAVSRVAAQGLQLDFDVTPDPVAPAQLMVPEITVTNPTGSATGALTLRVLWPEELSNVPVVTGGGDCPGGGCETGEYLEWDLGVLGPAASTTVGFDEQVRGNTDNGTLVPLELELIEGGLPARNNSRTALVNPFVDTDGDGMPDVYDDDADGDGMPDWWERLNGLDPLVDDAAGDADSDGLDNLGEFLAGSDPQDPDSDNDGIFDGLDRLPTIHSNLCAGTDVVFENTTILAGTTGTCAAPGSIQLEPTVVIEATALLELISLEVLVRDGVVVVEMADLTVISANPVAPVP